MGVYANIKSIEGQINGEETISFPWPSRHVEVINDSATTSLKVKFSLPESFITLHPTEVFGIEIRSLQLILQSISSVNYRVRILG